MRRKFVAKYNDYHLPTVFEANFSKKSKRYWWADIFTIMMAAQAVKARLAMVGINNFPAQVDDPLWNEIRQSVTPSLTLQEMIALKNDSCSSSSASAGNYHILFFCSFMFTYRVQAKA